MRRFKSLLNTVFRKDSLERDLDDELRTYLDDRIAARIAAGAEPGDARRQVLAEEGGVESVKERTRDVRAGIGVAAFVQDLRYGWRTLRRAPAFAAVACLTLALGIGGTVAIATVLESVLWRPLPYSDPDRLVVVEVDAGGIADAGASDGEIGDLRARTRTLERVARINVVAAHLNVDGEVDGLAAGNVSDDLLPVLGVAPVLGRTLEARLDAEQARGVLISDALWRRRFHGDPGAVGRWVQINNQPREIVGILPPGFRVLLPPSIGAPEQIDVWFSTGVGVRREWRGLGVVARLAGASTLADAQRELNGLVAELAAEHPAAYSGAGVRFRVRDVREALTSPVRPGLRALAVAVAFVLLLSCVNVANLLLARGAHRGRELAIRRALGASRVRLIRQLITENLLTASIGCLLGVLAARQAIRALEWLRPAHLPRQAEIGMDASVAGIAIGVTLAAALFFGGLPAFRLTAGQAQLPSGSRGETIGRRGRRLQRALVVAEIALSIVPLVAAGLMLRSFVNLTVTRLGFDPRGVVVAEMPLSFRQFPDHASRWQLHQRAFERLRALPGVGMVSAGGPVPFGPLPIVQRYGRAGDAPPARVASWQSVFPGYLAVMGTRLVAGRDFSVDDVSHDRRVALIDQRIADALWPAGAIGQRLALASESRVAEYEVVGVTEPVRTTSVRDDTKPHVFVPYHVSPIEMAIVLKATAPADALAPLIRREIAALGTGRAVDVRPLESFVRDSIAETRFLMLVLSAFAAAAMLLAAIGLYGTLAYLTSQRAREFGVRIALGATRRQLVGLVAREGVLLTVTGVTIGVAGALAIARAMRSLLYGVEAIDPLTLAAVGAVTIALAVAACTRPAWSAARTDPSRVMAVE